MKRKFVLVRFLAAAGPLLALGNSWAQMPPPTSQGVYDQIAAGRPQDAVEIASRLVKLRGEDVWAWVALANAHYAANNIEQALAVIEQGNALLGFLPELQKVRSQIQAALPKATSVQAQNLRTPGPEPTSTVWQIADSGFKAFDRGDHKLAAENATLAVTAAPEVEEYRNLLINALVALKEYAAANNAIDAAIARLGPRENWLGNRSLVSEQLAAGLAAKAHGAIMVNDLDLAITRAKDALEFAPNANEMRNLLILMLLQSDRDEEAAAQVDLALQKDPDDVRALVLRAHVSHRMRNYNAAKADFEAALKHPFMDDHQERWLRLIYADSAIIEGDLSLVRSLLDDKNFKSTDDETFMAALEVRRVRLGAVEKSTVSRKRSLLAVHPPILPAQQCRLTPYGNVCIYVPGVPGFDRGYAKATASYAAMSSLRFSEAASLAEEAVSLVPSNLQYRQLWLDSLTANGQIESAYLRATQWLTEDPENVALLLKRSRLAQLLGNDAQARTDLEAALATGTMGVEARIVAKADTGLKAQAADDLRAAIKLGLLQSVKPAQMAYLALKVGADELALENFREEAKMGTPVSSVSADAAFTALRLKLDVEGLSWLKKAIDGRRQEVGASAGPDKSQSLFELQRSVAEVARTWGATGTLTWGSQSIPASTGLSNGGLSQQSLVVGGEVFWRPWGYRNGSAWEPFVRGYAVLDNSLGGSKGIENGVYSVGLRGKPISNSPLTLTVWQQLPTRKAIVHDSALQISYFAAKGTDLRLDAVAWWTWQLSADLGRYMRQKFTFGNADFKAGRSFSTAYASGGWVFQPFIGLRADLNSSLSSATVQSADVGFSARYWYRGDVYTAPMSYTDIELRHRVASSGGQWPNATVLRVTTSY